MGQEVYKYLGIRIMLIVVLLMGMNLMYTSLLLKDDLKKFSPILELVNEIPKNTEVLYVAESSNVTFSDADADKRKISEMLDALISDKVVNDLTKPAAHAGVYYPLLRQIPEDSEIETVIVTLNLRSFNAQWMYSDLETALQKEITLLQPRPNLYNRFLLSFKGYDVKTKEEREKQFKSAWKAETFDIPFDFEFENTYDWEAYVWSNGVLNEKGERDGYTTAMMCHFIKGYAFQIDTLNHPRIADFNAVVDLAQQRNWNLVFNLIPENTQRAQKLVGEELVYMMNQNAELLTDYYSKKGVTVANNLNLVEDSQFIDRDWTTEHYAEKGRSQVAEVLAKVMSKQKL